MQLKMTLQSLQEMQQKDGGKGSLHFDVLIKHV